MNSTTAAELAAAAEAINGYQRRIGRLAATTPGDEADLLTAIYEAERALGVAEKSIRRAVRLASKR
ncbi:hypothetical protein [Desertimonas flava]|jgi:hypothetical protein|uniref:hypothetical protein n=1 Tax=Desertimonas flava TaxID=2064846 RepID=UPI000E345E1F|nr:hypothetical protein [Desertimonas flava]